MHLVGLLGGVWRQLHCKRPPPRCVFMTPRATFCSEDRQGVETHRVVLLGLLAENFIRVQHWFVCALRREQQQRQQSVLSPVAHGLD